MSFSMSRPVILAGSSSPRRRADPSPCQKLPSSRPGDQRGNKQEDSEAYSLFPVVFLCQL